jgi:hypothetical protein
MEATLSGFQETVLKRGPLMARFMKEPSKRIVRMVVLRWASLTAGPEEAKWAKKRIKEDVVAAYPFWAAFLLKILVSLIIKWIMSNRDSMVDAKIAYIRKGLQ